MNFKTLTISSLVHFQRLTHWNGGELSSLEIQKHLWKGSIIQGFLRQSSDEVRSILALLPDQIQVVTYDEQVGTGCFENVHCQLCPANPGS